MNMSTLTAAQIGSAVRWVITNGGALLAARGIATGFDWVSIGGGVASLVMLLWSGYSNVKKVG